MDDRFLHELRRDPDPQFARRLRERLRGHERPGPVPLAVRWARPVLAAVLAMALVAALFAFPSVRASAQAMLDLFRVRNFTAVEFDPARLEKLEELKADQLLGFDRVEVLEEPRPAQAYPTPQAAGAAAGLEVRVPTSLPSGLALDSVIVKGAGAARLVADAGRLRALLDALEIRDVTVPAGLDGQSVTVRTFPAVIQRYKSDRRHVELIQARSPEVPLPAGVDLAQLAEIGMRVIGVDATQARRLARSVDWHTTLLVPIPDRAATFRGVQVSGNPGLLITSTGEAAADGKRRRDGALVLWSEGDRVFGLSGNLDGASLMEVAESVR